MNFNSTHSTTEQLKEEKNKVEGRKKERYNEGKKERNKTCLCCWV